MLQLEDAKAFALRSLDRILSEAWKAETGALNHVIAYSPPAGTGLAASEEAASRVSPVRGLLDDYAFTAIACLDAWETTADISYFKFARAIADAMLERFFDASGGGFSDAETSDAALGALITRRKPFQDSPTPSGNSAAAILLLRLHALTNQASYRERSEATLETFAGVAGQFGIFASTYAIAVMMRGGPHAQICVIGNDGAADALFAAAVAPLACNRTVLMLRPAQVVAPMLPPALAETLPNLLAVREQKQSFAVICSDFTCQPPIANADMLTKVLRERRSPQ